MMSPWYQTTSCQLVGLNLVVVQYSILSFINNDGRTTTVDPTQGRVYSPNPSLSHNDCFDS